MPCEKTLAATEPDLSSACGNTYNIGIPYVYICIKMAQNALLSPSAPHNQKVEIHLLPSEASGCMASMKSHKEYNKGPVLSRVLQRCMTQWPLSHRSGSHTPPSGWQRPRLPTPDMATCCHMPFMQPAGKLLHLLVGHSNFQSLEWNANHHKNRGFRDRTQRKNKKSVASAHPPNPIAMTPGTAFGGAIVDHFCVQDLGS